MTSSKVSADDKNDPEFWNITENRSLLKPGETFEFIFTKPGKYEYHSEPHPHKHGTVIVLEPEK
ncbi:MAG: plastocyanin/azurin family copper-binding protein [Thermoproteota archaeon]